MPHSRLSLWVGTLSIRRWHAHSKLFALVLTVALVSGSVLSGSLLLVRSAEDAGIRGALASMTAERVDVSVRIINPDSPVAETRSAVDRATELAYGTGVSWTSRSWITTNWVTTANDLFTYAVELDEPSAAAKLVEGQWPTSPQGIAVPFDAAGSLGVAVGDTVTLDNNGSDVALRVDALYQASPESGVFWENDPLSAAGDIDGFPEPGRSFFNPVHVVGPLIIGSGGVDASAISPAQLEAVEHPSFEATDVAGLGALRERVVEADTGIPLAVAHSQGQLFVDSNLAASLGDVDSGLTATRQLALIVALVLLVVVAVAAFAVTRLLVGSRTAEFDLLRARGASNAQVALTAGLDAVTVGLVVLVASPWGGVLLRAIIVGTPPLSTVGLDRWILPDASAWISSAVVAIIMVGLLWLPSAPRRVRLGRVPAGAITLALRSAVIVAAAVMVWRAIATPPQPGDPLLAATPAVLLVAIALVGGRVTTALTHPAAVLAGRSRGVVAPLAGWFASRGPGRSGGVALVALAVAASVVVLGINATWRQALRDEAAVAVGPAYRIAAQQNPQGPQATLLAGDLRDAAPVLRRETVVRKELLFGAEGEAPGASVQVLGLSDAARRSLDFGTVAAAGGSAVVNGLPPQDDDDTGPLLPSGVEAFGATVELAAPEGVQAEISVVCEDSTGTLAVYSLGTVTPGTTVVTSTEPITTTDERNPTRLVAVTMQLRQDGEPVDPATFTSTVSALSAITATTTAAGSPISLRDAQGWAGSASNDPTKPFAVSVTDSEIAITATNQLGSKPVTYGAVGWDPLAPVEAIVPTELADDLDATDGSDLTAFIGGTPVSLRMVGDIAAVPGAATADDLDALEAGLPTSSRGETTIAVDGQALVHHLVQASATGQLADEFWLAPGAPPPVVTDGSGTVIAPSTVGQRMLEAPLRASVPALVALAVSASLLLALAGFGARTAAVTRSRRLEAAQLRAIGLSARGMVAVATIDTVAIALAGIIIGVASGVVTLWAVGTRIASGGQAAAGALVLPWQAFTILPVALLAALAVISLGVAAGQRRLPLSGLLRTGSDG